MYTDAALIFTLYLGNILINVGPTKDGIIAPIFQERLLDLGEWLSVNGEAIYASVPWKKQNDTVSHTWYTLNSKSNAVYATTLIWPEKNILNLGSAVDLFQNNTTVTLLGNPEKLKVLPLLSIIFQANFLNFVFLFFSGVSTIKLFRCSFLIKQPLAADGLGWLKLLIKY